MSKKIVLLAFILVSVLSASFAQEMPSAEAIIARIKSAQFAVKDLSADTKTIITSNITLPGTESKGPQTVTQIGHIWTKGQNLSKMEITSPAHQITITKGTLMTIISPVTGRKFTQDLSKIQGEGIKGQGLNAANALDYFNLTVEKAGTEEYVISGVPREKNQFLGRMDFIIDIARNVPVRITMYNPQGALLSLSELEYMQFEIATGEVVYVPKKIKSTVTMSMGSVNSDMEYSNIIVNQGIKDSVFEAD